MVVIVDIKNTNLSKVSVFSGASTGGGRRGFGNGGGVLEDADGYLTLSYKQRLIGFLICLVAGAIIVMLSFIFIQMMMLRPFVVCFSIGNIIALCSTMFLMGPLTQLKRMFHPVRLIATIVFLASIAAAIYFGYFMRNLLLALLFGVIELFALFWYSISYIPYARTVICKCIGF